ncbi:MAG: hypothetical protein HEQ23_15735 [Tepidisphaera sp.]
MARSVRNKATTPTRRRALTKGRVRAKRSVMLASVGGLSVVCLFGLAGCVAVMAGAAAGMLASRTTVATADPNNPSALPPTATVGDSVDQLADSAGQVLARTIKEQVPRTVRTVPTPAAVKPARSSTLATPAAKPADDASR